MNKTLIKKSKLHKRGVFASEDIKKGEIIEECNLILISKKDLKFVDKTSLYNYYFGWNNSRGAIALGNGSLYNHSYNPNAIYKKEFSKNKIIFTSLKNIDKGCEITVNYNGNPSIKKKVWFDK